MEAVDGQDHAAGGGRHPAEAFGVDERESEQFVKTVQEVGDSAGTEGNAASDQLGVDLGDAGRAAGCR